MSTIFEKIRDGEIPSVKIYDDDLCFVILDNSPINKGHALVISKEPVPTFSQINTDILLHMIEIAKKVDLKMKEVLKTDGSNILINNGKASGQEVPHLHIHVIPRFFGDNKGFSIPNKEKYKEGEMIEFGEKLKI